MNQPNLQNGVKATNQPRALYDALVEKYRRHPNAKSIVITESYLWLMLNVQGASTQQISFNVLKNEGVQLSNEVRLNISDRFCVRDWGFFVQKAGASADPTAVTAAQIAVSRLNTYPNAAVFTSAADAVNMEAVYNSSLKVVIDSVVYYQNFPMRNFFRVPTAQQGTTTAAIAGPVQYLQGRDGWDSMNYAFSPVYPAYEFSGDSKNEVTITLPAATNLAGTGYSNYVSGIFRGYSIQNVNKSQ